MHKLLLAVIMAAMGLLVSAACAEDEYPFRAWVNTPSQGLAAQFRHWRLKYETTESQSAPENGVFPWIGNGGGTARLVNDSSAPRTIKLTPVAERTRYVRPDTHLSPDDKVVTRELVDVLRSPEVAKFIARERLNKERLDIDQNLAVVLVQDFKAALRKSKRREHIWSINWRVDRYTESDYAGFEAWGLFTRVNGILKPLYLAGRRSNGETPSASYYYVLAVGDLNGDGIDELIAREREFEQEQDNLEIWAWERGAPVAINKIP